MSDCPFCKVPCKQPHCPYTKKECQDCVRLEEEKKRLVEIIKGLEKLLKKDKYD
jgi:hypothetical protein